MAAAEEQDKKSREEYMHSLAALRKSCDDELLELSQNDAVQPPSPVPLSQPNDVTPQKALVDPFQTDCSPVGVEIASSQEMDSTLHRFALAESMKENFLEKPPGSSDIAL